jgi:hypothetical protein
MVTSSRATYDVTGAPTLGPFGLKSCVRLVSVTRPVKRASPYASISTTSEMATGIDVNPMQGHGRV